MPSNLFCKKRGHAPGQKAWEVTAEELETCASATWAPLDQSGVPKAAAPSQ